MAAECGFSWRVELVAFRKEGFSHLGKMVDNLVSRGKELPGNAYFRTPLERRISQRTGREELFWKGYDRSISESMRRNAALLKLRGAPKEKIDQARVEWQIWNQLQDTILNLEPDQAVQFLALRGLNPEDGVALQQVSWQDGQLVLESQLLPLGQLEQTENLMALVGKDREMIEMNMEGAEGLSPLVTWAVKGRVIDFKQDLAELTQKSLSVNQEIRPIHVIDGVSEGAGVSEWHRAVNQDVHFGNGHGLEVHPTLGKPLSVSAPSSEEKFDGFWFTVRQQGGDGEVPVEVLVESHLRSVTDVSQPVVASVVIADELQTRSVSDYKIEEGTTEVTPLRYAEQSFEGQAEDVSTRPTSEEFRQPADHQSEVILAPVSTPLLVPVVSEVTTTDLPRYGEVSTSQLVEAEKIVEDDNDLTPVVVEQQQIQQEVKKEVVVMEGAENSVISDSSVNSVIEEAPEINEDYQTEEVKQKAPYFAKATWGRQKLVFSAVSDEASVPSVVSKLKSIKAKMIWLQGQLANVVADGLVGRMFRLRRVNVGLGWLVHGLALMQFDGVEKKGFDGASLGLRLSPRWIWADRVVRAVKKMKHEFVQVGLGAYRQLFATI